MEATSASGRRLGTGCWITAAATFLLISAVTFPFWGLWIRLRRANQENITELERRRDRYEAIVRRIAAVDMPNLGAQYSFEIAADRDPTSLKAFVRDDGDAKYSDLHRQGRLIQAWREPRGLTIVFITKDYGHMGVYSLVYSNPPESPGKHFRGNDQVTQLDPYWRAIYDPHY